MFGPRQVSRLIRDTFEKPPRMLKIELPEETLRLADLTSEGLEELHGLQEDDILARRLLLNDGDNIYRQAEGLPVDPNRVVATRKYMGDFGECWNMHSGILQRREGVPALLSDIVRSKVQADEALSKLNQGEMRASFYGLIRYSHWCSKLLQAVERGKRDDAYHALSVLSKIDEELRVSAAKMQQVPRQQRKQSKPRKRNKRGPRQPKEQPKTEEAAQPKEQPQLTVLRPTGTQG